MRFSPVKLLGIALLVMALICAWRARLDLARGETKWIGWARLAAPASRRDTPLRYWWAMFLNVLVLLMFAVVGAFAMRSGVIRLAP